MNKRHILTFLLLCIGLTVMAQQIKKYEYWLDQGHAQRITKATTTNELEFDIDLSGLNIGLHVFNFRAQDSEGRWTAPSAGFFFVGNKIDKKGTSQYEYWLDREEADRTVVNSNASSFTLDVDVTKLCIGMHTFSFRYKDENGRWSTPQTSIFFIPSSQKGSDAKSTYEYWIDNNQDSKTTVSGHQGLVDLSIDVNNLSRGLHTLSFRASDSKGVWSAPQTSLFLVNDNCIKQDIVKYRYWFNDASEHSVIEDVSPAVTPYILDAVLPVTDIISEVTPDNIALIDDGSGIARLGTKNVLHTQYLTADGRWTVMSADTFAVAINAKEIYLTGFIKNPIAADNWNGWNTEGNTTGIQNSQTWDEGKNYFRLGNTSKNGWTASMEQTINSLPAGTYKISAKGRTAEGVEMRISSGDYSEVFPDLGIEYGELSNGWNERSIIVSTDGEQPLVVKINGSAQESGKWMDVSDFRLCYITLDETALQELYVRRINELDNLYATANMLCTRENYYGRQKFRNLLDEVKLYADGGYLSEDSHHTNLEYVEIIINKLTEGMKEYEQSASVAFPEEIALLNSAVPTVKEYKILKSHISSIDVSYCGLEEMPLELLKLPALVSLNASHNNIANISIPEEYKPMLSGKNINLQYQEINKTIDINYGKMVDYKTLMTLVPSLPYYDIASNTSLAKGMYIRASLNQPDKAGSDNWSLNIDYASGTPVLSVETNGEYAYRGAQGDILYITYPKASDAVRGSFYRSRFFFDMGDANFINGIDATDLQATILYAFGEYNKKPFNFTAADTYTDGNINVQDVVCTVNIMLDNEAIPAQNPNSALRSKSIVKSISEGNKDAYIYMRGGKIYLHSQIPVASISIKAEGNVKWHIDKAGMQQSTSKANVVAYSLNGITLPYYEDVELGEYTNARIYSASLSDDKAEPIFVRLDDSATVAAGIGISSEINDNEWKIYDISGNRRTSVKKGINIIRINGVTRKVFKK